MDAAEKNLQITNNFTQAVVNTFLTYLVALMDNAATRDRYRLQIAMGKYKGEKVLYAPKGEDAVKRLRELLVKNNVPHIMVPDTQHKGNELFLIREIDKDKVAKLNTDILLVDQNYFIEKPASDLENAIASAPNLKNRDVFTLHGLNMYEVEAVRNKFNNMGRGFTVGRAKEANDLQSLTIRANKAFTNTDESTFGKDFCRATLESVVSLYGSNMELKVQQIIADKEFENTIPELKSCQNPRYIVGAFDNDEKINPVVRTYIRVTQSGFEMEKQAYDKEKNILSPVQQMSFCLNSDPNYEVELMKCISSIKDCVVIDDINFEKYQYAQPFECDLQRPRKNIVEEQVSSAEDTIVALIDESVRNKMLSEGYLTCPADLQFNAYMKFSSEILDAAYTGIESPNFDKMLINEIKKISETVGINPEVMAGVSERTKTLSCEVHKAKTIKRERNKEEVSKE